jgi:hypothetical protein
MAHAAVIGAHDQLDVVAARVVETHAGTHAALFAFGGAGTAHIDAGVAECCGRRVQRIGIAQLEADALVGRIAFEVDQRVVALSLR